MEVLIGKFTLTPNQQSHLIRLNDGVVKGVSYQEETGRLVAVVNGDIPDEEKKRISDEVKSFPDIKIQSKDVEEISKKFNKKKLLEKVGWDEKTLNEIAEVIKEVIAE